MGFFFQFCPVFFLHLHISSPLSPLLLPFFLFREQGRKSRKRGMKLDVMATVGQECMWLTVGVRLLANRCNSTVPGGIPARWAGSLLRGLQYSQPKIHIFSPSAQRLAPCLSLTLVLRSNRGLRNCPAMAMVAALLFPDAET